MKTLKTLSRRTLLFLIALPAVAITVISLGALLSAVTTAAADSQPGAALYELRQPALEFRPALTVDSAVRGQIDELLNRPSLPGAGASADLSTRDRGNGFRR